MRLVLTGEREQPLTSNPFWDVSTNLESARFFLASVEQATNER